MSASRIFAAVLFALGVGYFAGCAWSAGATQGASLFFAALVSGGLFFAAHELWTEPPSS